MRRNSPGLEALGMTKMGESCLSRGRLDSPRCQELVDLGLYKSHASRGLVQAIRSPRAHRTGPRQRATVCNPNPDLR